MSGNLPKVATAPKVAIVTGAARGLGREYAIRLATYGYAVAIVDVDAAGAEETAQLVAEGGGIARVEVADVTSIDAWTDLRRRLQTEWPRLDLLINNAGMYAAGNVGSLDLAEAERVVRLNLMSVLYGCHTMTPWLVESAKSGGTRPRVINVASSFAFLCPPGMAPYNLSKAAVIALSETLHGELKPHNVGVTVVCPGPMPTRFVENASFASEAFRRMTDVYVQNSRLDPAAVAAESLAASERGELYVVTGTEQRWYWRAKRWLPRTLLSSVARRVRRDLAAAKKLAEN